MIKVIPKKMFSWEFYLWEEQDPIGSADYAWFRGSGWLVLPNAEYVINAGNAGNGPFELIALDGRIASTQCECVTFQHKYSVHYDSIEYTLKQESPLRRSFEVMDRGKYLGCIVPEKIQSRAAISDIPEDMPLFIRAFLIGLVINIWTKQTAGVDIID